MPQIKPKPTIKKCKGTTSETKGFGCGQELSFSERNGIKTYHAQKGLGIRCRCYQNWLLSSENVIKKGIEKGKVLIQKEERKKNAEEKKKLKNAVTNWKNELQDEVNKIIRLIDRDLPCLAKGKYANQMHAGHVFSRGSNPTIRYNCHNIHRQSAQSNHFQNEDGLLREGLVAEYGQSYMDFISELRRTPKLNFNNQEYHELTLKARKIVLSLTKEDKVYLLNERIELRNQINLELGIYLEEFCVFNQ